VSCKQDAEQAIRSSARARGRKRPRYSTDIALRAKLFDLSALPSISRLNSVRRIEKFIVHSNTATKRDTSFARLSKIEKKFS